MCKFLYKFEHYHSFVSTKNYLPSFICIEKRIETILLENLKLPKTFAGDGQRDSMDGSAKYYAYTIFSCTVPYIIDFSLVQVGQYKKYQLGYFLVCHLSDTLKTTLFSDMLEKALLIGHVECAEVNDIQWMIQTTNIYFSSSIVCMSVYWQHRHTRRAASHPPRQFKD